MPSSLPICKTLPPRKRILFILTIFSLITVVLVTRLCWLVCTRYQLHEKLVSNSLGDKILVIPGLRAEIHDADGNLLAWSERFGTLTWHIPNDYLQAEQEWAVLAQHDDVLPMLPNITHLSDHLGRSCVLLKDRELAFPAFWNILGESPTSLELDVSFKRHLANSRLASIIGEVTTDAQTGVEIGISGLEKKYDEQLRARPFKLVLLRSHQRLILPENTGNGKNVKLSEKLDIE